MKNFGSAVNYDIDKVSHDTLNISSLTDTNAHKKFKLLNNLSIFDITMSDSLLASVDGVTILCRWHCGIF